MIVRSKFVYKFSLTLRRVKVSSFQGFRPVFISCHDVTCWIYKTHELKILKYVPNTGVLTQPDFKLCRTDKELTSLQRNVPSL